MAIKDVTPKEIDEEFEQFGFEADTEEYDDDYVPRNSTEGLSKVVLNDLPVGKEIVGEPDIAIYINDEKEINGKKFEAKKWDTVNARLFSDEDYLEIYINVPKIDEDGFIHNINKNNKFFENCFNLIFGYMRLVNEDAVLDPESPSGYINHIKKINIRYLVEKLNELTDIKLKVTEGNKGYQGFIITEIWD